MNLRRAVTPFVRGLFKHYRRWRPTFGSFCNFEAYGFSNTSKKEEERSCDYIRRFRRYTLCRMMPDPFVECASAKVCPAIVHVSREKGIGGSGFIIDSKGTVLTSADNILPLDASSKINVTLLDGRKFSGTILEANMDHYLALLKIQSKIPLPTIPMLGSLGNCEEDRLISIGHPLKRRAYPRPSSQNEVDEEGNLVLSYEEFISKFGNKNFDLGRAGGPIVNLDGEVVGISTGIHIINPLGEKSCFGTIEVMAIEEAFGKVGYVENGFWLNPATKSCLFRTPHSIKFPNFRAMNLRRAVTPFVRGLFKHYGPWRPTFGSFCNFEAYGFSNTSKKKEEISCDYIRRFGRYTKVRRIPDPFVECASAKVCPAIVHVSREKGIGGSGFIIDSKGTVLTSVVNIFPLDATSKINVSLLDGGKFSGTILEANMDHRLALLKIQSKIPLPTIPMLGSLENCEEDRLISIGHPLKRRAYPRPSSQNEVDQEGNLVLSYEEFISKFGNTNFYLGRAGGPIVNLDGEVVGISTGIKIINPLGEKSCFGTIEVMAIEEAFGKVGYVENDPWN